MKYDSTNCCYLTRWLLDPITLKAWTTSQHKGSFTSRISCNTSPAPAANEALSSLFKCKPPVIWAKGETPSWGAARNQLPGYTTTKPSPPEKSVEKYFILAISYYFKNSYVTHPFQMLHMSHISTPVSSPLSGTATACNAEMHRTTSLPWPNKRTVGAESF